MTWGASPFLINCNENYPFKDLCLWCHVNNVATPLC
jgi:hypothetical protein